MSEGSIICSKRCTEIAYIVSVNVYHGKQSGSLLELQRLIGVYSFLFFCLFYFLFLQGPIVETEGVN